MIYSKWIPDRGGYEYYEVPERRGMGDDLPIPKLRATSPLGVASTSIGRTPPLAGKLVGTGPIARGCIMPLDRTGLSGISSPATQTAALVVLFVLTAAGARYFGQRVLG